MIGTAKQHKNQKLYADGARGGLQPLEMLVMAMYALTFSAWPVSSGFETPDRMC